ncbi:MAG TPA: DUF642 domain-containing protein [Verrucomicrobiota bacterium]|nr:hypothetical protein [Verrucomicrobiales bacterium]HRI12252.1 DUF642 domain-containing protein [Verrucomicrobiota bacterium]
MNINPITVLGIAGFSLSSVAVGENLIQNGSFESPTGNYELVPGGVSYPPGWQTRLNGVEIFTSTDLGLGYPYPTTIQDGVKAVDLAPYYSTGGGISQTFATTPGMKYEVSFWAGTENNFGKDGTGNIVAEVVSALGTFALANHTADWVWESKSLPFVAGSSSTTLTFQSLDNPFQHVASIDGVAVVPTGGGANLVGNGSFETPPGNYEYIPGGSTYINDWTTILNGVEIFTNTDIGLGYPYPTTIGDGVKAVDLAPYTYQGGGITQVLSTVPGQSYELTFLAGTVESFGKDGTGTVEAILSTQFEFALENFTSDIVWEKKTFSFVASGPTSTLTFYSFDDASQHLAAIDNVVVRSQSVPESSPIGMATLILAAAAIAHRRNRN